MKNNVSIHSSFSATWAIAHLSSESRKLESSIKQVNQNNWLKKINLEVCRGKKITGRWRLSGVILVECGDNIFRFFDPLIVWIE